MHESLVNVCEFVYFFWRIYMFFHIFVFFCMYLLNICMLLEYFYGNCIPIILFICLWIILPVCLCFIFKVFACVYGWFYVLHDIRSIILCKIRNENQIQKWVTVIDTNQFGYESVLYSMRMSMRIYMLHVSFHVTCYDFRKNVCFLSKHSCC